MGVNGENIITVFEEDGSMIFATRHEWDRLREDDFGSLKGFVVLGLFCGSGGVFQVLRDCNPVNFPRIEYKLLKATTDDETGKCILYVMDISEAEADNLLKIRDTLWEN